MINFNVKKLPYDLSSHAGLALVGKCLRRIKLDRMVDAQFPVRSGLPNSAVIKSFLALLCTGKNDFNAIEAFRGDAFFKRALGLDAVPSSPTMRQRMDTHAQSWFDLVWELNRAVLDLRINGRRTDFGALDCGYIPVDIDSFVMDNSGTKKELIGRSYTGVDGYCPLAAYIGTSGYCLALSLRPGTQHSARETDNDLEHLLPMATSVAAGPLLLRCDSGFCSLKLMQTVTLEAAKCGREIAFLIKWNPRGTPVEAIATDKVADSTVVWRQLRPGKRECVWQEALTLEKVGSPSNPARRVYRLTERTIDKHGQPLLLPEYELEGWSTTLPERFSCADVIALYCDHATHEQFHSEFKTDMDIERLPSGKFDTNYLVCQLAAVALNLLRLIGQNTLNEPDSPMRHQAKRRRIKTVIQEIICKAARMVHHAGCWVLGLGANDSAAAVFERHYGHLDSA